MTCMGKPTPGLSVGLPAPYSSTVYAYKPTMSPHMYVLGTCKHEPSETLETAKNMFATKHCLYRISHCDWLQNAQNCLKQVRHFITTRGDVFSSVT